MTEKTQSRSRLVASIAVLSALAFVLSLTVQLPFPLASYLYLELWEIPAYLALFVYGLRPALAVAFVVLFLVQIFSPGPLPTGPLYNFIAVISTMIGAIIVTKVAGTTTRSSVTLGLAVVILSAVSRILLMTVVNSLVLPYPYPIGFSIPPSALPPILVVTAIFNAVVALYSVTLALLIAARVTPSPIFILTRRLWS